MSAKFGESFHIDAQSRVNVLDKSAKLPEYVEFSRNIRKLLKGQTEGQDFSQKENWPECPKNLESLDDFFEAAKVKVTERWQQVVTEILETKYQEWLKQIPQTKEYQDVINLLKNPKELESKLRIMQFGELEPLKEVQPEAWRNLLLASSERQLTTLTLLRHWAKTGLTDQQADKLGTNKTELDLMLDASGILGKYIDHAYVKQVELADEPGGTTKTKLGERGGAEYIYDLTDTETGKIDKKTYAEVFPGEWPRIIKGLEMLSNKTKKLLVDQRLPKSYADFPEYLDKLIEVFGSKEVSPKKLNQLHRELDQQMQNLVKAGCPLMIVVGDTVGVTDEANKIDIDLRFGLRTPGLKKMEAWLDQFTAAGQKIVDQHQDKLAEKYQVPKMILNNQPLAFGSNLQYFTPAESGSEAMLSHVNTNNEVAKEICLPLLNKIHPEQTKKIKSSKYLEIANLDTALHEVGHNIMSEDDEAIKHRIGVSSETAILEELKAETISIKLFNEVMKEKPVNQAKELSKQEFMAKLGTVYSFLANKSSKIGSEGERYFYTGAAIVSELLDKKILIEKNDQYQITNSLKGLKVIADLGDEVLSKFYTNPEKNLKKEVKQYIRVLREKKNDPALKKFIENLKG